MQSFIVFLRFDSLTKPGPPKRSYKEISIITKVHPSAIFNVCRRWVKNGYKVINKRLGPRKRWYTSEIESFLTKPQTLLDWAHLSLH